MESKSETAQSHAQNIPLDIFFTLFVRHVQQAYSCEGFPRHNTLYLQPTASVDITLGAAPDKVWKLITTFVALPLAINSLPFVMITFVVLNYCSRNSGNLVLSGGASGLRISSSDSIRALKKSVLFPLGTTVSLRS